MLTYDVDVWGITVRKGRNKPYVVRWRVGRSTFNKGYRLRPQADGRRTELLQALRKRERFDEETGLPESEVRELNTASWYEHSLAYMAMKWASVGAKHRAGLGDMLLAVTPVLVTGRKGGRPERKELRLALRLWAYQLVPGPEGRRVPRIAVEEPPEAVGRVLQWVAANSLPLPDAARSDPMRAALEAITLRLDGERAAENTIRRRWNALHNALNYAVERGQLPSNPLDAIDWTVPKTEDEVDLRYVPGPRQSRSLIEAVRGQGARGEHLRAFFGCIYFAATRPSEAAMLKKADCVLPGTGWGELILASTRPEVGSGWTDDGGPYEDRGLKHRARKTTRSIPIPPEFVRMLREHIEAHGTAPDGRLFSAVRGGRVSSNEYTAVWKKARQVALTAAEADSLFADVPYSLRHAGISLWIKAGVDPVEVAERAGHSLAVLYRIYAKLLKGNRKASNELIEKALEDEPQEDPEDPPRR
ncbi:site-specific integrase [Mangrovactinospora gilvigrisea]|uniref:Site-specific integrase n=1 Tax=Mangrovactinospora gilvigrisea TaxID=1428644 RepID=A0A1J7CAB2_9ACTN|nr:tyrosine-type recombinase/integrase [Mangrovactinospora gilvigrisea]OIV38452.1 site-specific integrase [Mangrovactinospora gilvigrisea]